MHRFPSIAGFVLVVLGLSAAPALAAGVPERTFHVDFGTPAEATEPGRPVSRNLSIELVQSPSPEADGTDPADQRQRVVPFEYSDGYRTRARIHRIASFATLPLFATEAVIGQSLYHNPTSGKRDAHLAVAGAIGALFAVNTVTGVWNLIEARKDPEHRGRRLAHGLLMLASDAGFLATAALAPDDDGDGSRGAHRAMAFTAISLATAGYLIMLFGG
jgi:hypothetical protein